MGRLFGRHLGQIETPFKTAFRIPEEAFWYE